MLNRIESSEEEKRTLIHSVVDTEEEDLRWLNWWSTLTPTQSDSQRKRTTSMLTIYRAGKKLLSNKSTNYIQKKKHFFN